MWDVFYIPAYLAELLLMAACLALIPAFIADKRGRSFLGWWLFGFLLFIVALPLVFILDPIESANQKRCPKCAEFIRREAIVCRYCRYEFGVNDDLRIA